jgi:Ca-activated chloride channel homolog
MTMQLHSRIFPRYFVRLSLFALTIEGVVACSAADSASGPRKVRDPVVVATQRPTRESAEFVSAEPPALEAREAGGPSSDSTRLVYSHVNAVVRAGSVSVRVVDVVSNDGISQVDFSYSFPLPSDATVTELAHFNNGKRIVASAQEKTQAKANFEQAKARGESATLTENTGNSRFSVAMSPLAPGESRRVELSYVQSLESFGAQRSFSFPAAHSERRGDPTLDFQVDIESDAELSRVASLNHPDARLVKLDANTERVLLNRTASSLGQDLVVRWTERAEPLELSLRAIAGKATEPGFAQVDFAFNVDTLGAREPARDFVFVVDTSLSMAGEALDQAKTLVQRSLEHLTERDRLALVQFDDQLASWGALMPASAEAKNKALSELSPKRAAGFSNVEAAIDRARELTQESKNPVIVLVTDGQSTVGDTPDILAPASKPSDFEHTRVFVALVNYPSRQPQLEQLFPHATLRFLPGGDAGRELARSLAQLVAAPVLENVQLTIEGMSEEDRYGKVPERLSLGDRIRVLGRSNATSLKARVNATLHGEAVQFEKSVPLSARESDLVSVPREWARTKLSALETRYGAAHDPKDQTAAIELAKQFGLVSSFTSLLATDALSPDRVAPGDPELRIRAPRSASSVVAILPWGEQVECSFHEAEGLWLGRFLVPRSIDDGLYKVRVFTTSQGKTARRSSLFLRVDSKAPRYQIDVRAVGEGLELDAVPEADVFDRNGDAIRLDLVDVKSVSATIAGTVHTLTPTTDGKWTTRIASLGDGSHRITLVASDYAQNSSRSTALVTVADTGRRLRISRAKPLDLPTKQPAGRAVASAATSAPEQVNPATRCWFAKSARLADLHAGEQHVELFENLLRIDGREVTPCTGLPAARPVSIVARGGDFLVAFRDGTRSLYRAGAFEPVTELTKAELAALAPRARPALPSHVIAGDLPSSHVSALAVYRDELVVGSFDGGVFTIDAKERIVPLRGAPRFVNALLAEPTQLWLAGPTGLFLLKDGEFREIPLGFAASHVNGLTRAADGTLWLATGDGLLGLRDGQWRKLDERQGLPSRIVYAVSEGVDGTLWAGTAAGVARISKDGLETFRVDDGSLPHRWVTALLPDGDSAYVGTYQGGVTRLARRGATPLPGSEALWINPHGLTRIDGRLYAASMGGGLVAFEPARDYRAAKLGALPDSDVTAVAAFEKALWIGTSSGLARIPR